MDSKSGPADGKTIGIVGLFLEVMTLRKRRDVSQIWCDFKAHALYIMKDVVFCFIRISGYG